MYWQILYLKVLTSEPIGTIEVSKKLGCGYDTALKNLIRLQKAGKINGKKMNKTQWLWWALSPKVL